METAVIIIISLVILYFIITMVRESFKEKWYVRGYNEAYSKYDKSDAAPTKNITDVAKEKFHEDYGFHYD